MNEMLDYLTRIFKTVVIKILQQPIMNSLETNKKIEIFSKEKKAIKNNHMEII